MAKRRSTLMTIADYLLNLVQRIVVRGTWFLPFRTRSAIGGWFVRQMVRILPGARRRIDGNLALIFPDMTTGERRSLRNRSATNIGRTLTEIMAGRALHDQLDRIKVSGPGLDVVKQTRAEGRGAIIVSGHYGQWEAARVALKAMGMECAGVYRPNSNRFYDADFRENSELNGKPFFARGASGMRGLVRHLKSGGLAALLVDQALKSAPVSDFMGHPAHTSPGAAELAVKYDLPLIPSFAIRNDDDGTYDVIMEEPVEPGDPMDMMDEVNRRLEARIRQHPEQWYWLHKRWKLSKSAAAAQRT